MLSDADIALCVQRHERELHAIPSVQCHNRSAQVDCHRAVMRNTARCARAGYSG